MGLRAFFEIIRQAKRQRLCSVLPLITADNQHYKNPRLLLIMRSWAKNRAARLTLITGRRMFWERLRGIGGRR